MKFLKLVAMTTVLFGFTVGAQANDLSDLATRLQKSVVQIVLNGQSVCSGTKIGPKQFLTAGHCAIRGVKVQFGYEVHTIRSVLLGVGTKDDGDSRYDWAVFNTYTDSDNAEPLEVDCKAKPYIGEPIAAMGYPVYMKQTFSAGYVSNLEGLDINGYEPGSDFWADMNAAPGNSGSAVVDRDSGKIIGVLVEGLGRQRTGGLLATGTQSASWLDLCQPELPQEKAEVKSSAGHTLRVVGDKKKDVPDSL